jgi:hypothetical protein
VKLVEGAVPMDETGERVRPADVVEVHAN